MLRTRGLLVAGLLLLVAGCSDDPSSPTPPLATGTWDVVLSSSGVAIDTTQMDVDERADGGITIAITLDGNVYTLTGTVVNSKVSTAFEAQPGYVAKIFGTFNPMRSEFIGTYITAYDHVVTTIDMRAKNW